MTARGPWPVAEPFQFSFSSPPRSLPRTCAAAATCAAVCARVRARVKGRKFKRRDDDGELLFLLPPSPPCPLLSVQRQLLPECACVSCMYRDPSIRACEGLEICLVFRDAWHSCMIADAIWRASPLPSLPPTLHPFSPHPISLFSTSLYPHSATNRSHGPGRGAWPVVGPAHCRTGMYVCSWTTLTLPSLPPSLPPYPLLTRVSCVFPV